MPSSSPPISTTSLQPARGAFLGTGFRPFFWFGTLMGSTWMLLWLCVLSGQFQSGGHLSWSVWHAHEMLFGFVLAIIAGFLLTATQNWTGRITANGPTLLFLTLLWMAGRLAMLFGNSLPASVVIAVDLAFIPCLIFFIGYPIIAAKCTRGLPLLAILGILASCNLLIHLGGVGYLPAVTIPALYATVNVITLLMVLIGGRIIPFFTRNALPTVNIQPVPLLDRLAIGAVVVLLITEVISGITPLSGAVALTAGILNAMRLFSWRGHKTLSQPLLWVLHLGYGWICAGLITKGLSSFLPNLHYSIAIHMLTVGAMGTLILGMISRVALGHTGRPLSLPSGMISAYLLLTLAAIIRVGGPLLLPAHTTTALLLSGGLWSAAFALYLIRYTPILWQPRVDGRRG
jgi:uncharacterized protein involved in response to NO